MFKIKKRKIINALLITFASLFFLNGFYRVFKLFLKTSKIEESTVHEKVLTSEKRVLFLSSYSPTYPILFAETTGISKVFAKENIHFDIEYLDAKTHTTTEYFDLQYETLKYKLENQQRYDGILAGDDAALFFIEKHQNELFKYIPIAFFAVDNMETAERNVKNPMISGTVEKLFLKDTIEIAIKLNPEATKVCAIIDDSFTGIGDKKQFFNEKPNFPDKEFYTINTSEKSLPELQNELSELKSDTILIFMAFTQDKYGNKYSLSDAVNLISDVTRIPIYRTSIGGIGKGIFGGKIFDFEKSAQIAAEMIASVLKQEKDISEIPLDNSVEGKYYFDNQLIEKFGFDKNLFPKDTIFLNRTPTLWTRYSEILVPAVLFLISLILILSVTVIGYANAKIAEATVKSQNASISFKNQMLKNSAQRMKFMSENDFLTRIPNRFSVTTEINRLINEKVQFSLYIMDIDDFKNLNDYYTHECGDTILKEFASRLLLLTTEMDCFVARYGGDEFMLVYRNGLLSKDNDSLKTIKLVMNQPIFYQSTKIEMHASGGIADYSEGMSCEELISNADLALYDAKRFAKDSTYFFDPKMRTAVNEKKEISEILQESCRNKGFSVRYQPQIDAKTGEIHGYEALCRLEDNRVGPAQFIPIAEESGYISSIGRIVTEKVISQMAEWRKNGIPLRKVAINYSNGQLVDAEYVNYLKSLLEKYNIPSELVEIEITESLFIGNTNLAHKLFDSLSEIGVKLALDDFGTGYSSLSYLTYLPVNKVKIDKTIVDNYLVEGKENFIKNIVHLVHDLGMELTVEGVEQEWQYDMLKELKADYIQGYYFSKPISGKEVETFSPRKPA